ncbi:PAS-domain containing protein [Salinisphaera sp. T31B1]|uniref:PAS domain-containing hybrid sensor histidine kinase/response regulator n=1 Tax=Salinisphaera sp. T31B1 TaxID=727963 RepID=UPI003341BB21
MGRTPRLQPVPGRRAVHRPHEGDSAIVSPWILVTSSIIYIGVLFAIAYIGDRRGRQHKRPGPRPIVYALSLAVYCTSWTFFGNVGTAATQGWTYLPIYVGPMIALLVFSPVLRKMLLIAKQQNTTSIADFIAARYGKSQGLAALVSGIALLVVLPYIALQLKALTMSFYTLTQGAHSLAATRTPDAPWEDTALYVAIMMAVFTIAFGTRHVNPRESHQGLILAIAFESVVKLAAFLCVGLFVVYGMFSGLDDLFNQAGRVAKFNTLFDGPLIDARFITTTVLAVSATLCLPRQFHVGVVENTDTRDLVTARWLFPLYLLLMSLFVVPLAGAGLVIFAEGTINPDRFVLALPLVDDATGIALIAYIGGVSAATSMVIMATVTLATMLCNEIVVPVALRVPRLSFIGGRNMADSLLRIRRTLIVLILVLAWCCYRLFGTGEALASIGLLSFSGVALFLPPLIGGLYIRRIGRQGVMAGLAVGIAVWAYTLVLPNLASVGWLDTAWIATGPFNIGWLKPQALFGYDFGDTLTHGVFWILALDTAVMAAVSLNTTSSLIERAQAVAFVDLGLQRPQRQRVETRQPAIRVGELEVLLQRFLGAQAARAALDDYAGHHSRELMANQLVDAHLLQFAERRLAGVVGSASARLMLASGLRQRDLRVDDMVRLLDRTADAVQFNRNVLQAALENIDHGISVIDQDLRLVAWNTRYLALFEYPPGLVRNGRPVADLIRFNAMRGECGPGPVEEHVRKRLEHMREGRPHRFERHRHNGTVLQMTGSPLPGGGFVTTFNDITAFKRTEAALTRANEQLEARVGERTAALSRANEGLRRENDQRAAAQRAAHDARREAERANLSKTRFLAAASHDLLQPLNAARLFAASARDNDGPAQAKALTHIQASLEAAQALLEPLLDISKFDAGAWEINEAVFPLSRVLDPLSAEFDALARNAGLCLHHVPSRCWVRSDPALLRRILQNFLSNAVRYTQRGRVLVGVRRGDQELRIQVWDTGPGIARDQLASIFDEFQRGSASAASGERGLGLGLSLADRMARLLGHRITVDSVPGRGTLFSLTVARAAPADGDTHTVIDTDESASRPQSLGVHQVLCVDDDSASLDALAGLLERWHIDCMTAPPEDAADILADTAIDVAILDHDLGADSPDGLALARQLCAIRPLPCLLVTANRDPDIAATARAQGVTVLYKPLSPAKLRAALAQTTLDTAADIGPS